SPTGGPDVGPPRWRPLGSGGGRGWGGGGRWARSGGSALVDAWGAPGGAAEAAADLEGVLAAAGRVGWPVALKTAAPGVVHKSDVGGVRLGLDAPARPPAAHADL